MSKKRWIQLIFAVGVLSTPVLYQNCSATHGEGSGDFSSRILLGAGACDQILIQGWEPYRNALATSSLCLNCHQQNGQSGKPFADFNNDISIQSLLDETETKIWDFALNPGHKNGFTGPQNQAILQPHRDTFQQAETEYSTCLAEQGQEENNGPGLPTPTIRSNVLPIPAAADILDNPQELVFNINGIQISVEISAWETALGNRGYDISVPTVQAPNGNGALYVKNMGIYLNNAIVPAPAGSAFQNVDRYIASGTTRTLYNSGVMNVSFNTLNANTISVAFQNIAVDPAVNFTPTTYQQLVNGVFANNCAQCHSGANPIGGFNLDSNASYTLNYLNGLFTPFDLDSQILDSVMTDRMPQGAPLQQADKELIRGWIMDGARLN